MRRERRGDEKVEWGSAKKKKTEKTDGSGGFERQAGGE